jgi:hypothetical protein
MADPRTEPGKILVGKADDYEFLTLALGNRHGLVTGATGTGKTVTLQTLAEGFSNAGVSVFASDIKGDLSGMAAQGDAKPPFVARAKEIGLDYYADKFPVVFWDLFGEQGHPVRATITEMGPLLTARLLELNDVQEGVLNIVFRIADEQGLLLLDLKDLRQLLQYVAEHADKLKTLYGNIAPSTVGAIQRNLLTLENQGAANFFGEPALDINDFLRKDRDGRGVVNIMAADKLMRSPRLYATFLLWMLSELFETLPEVGDLDKPKLVFFFDEAHLLFDSAPKALLDAIEQVVRLIRSKGVGVYFVTQNPLDVPETVLGQLGNRVQHALRAFTPRDQRAVRAAAETFRQNPKIDTATAITELHVGEALLSMLEGKGSPRMVQRALIAPPSARVGPVTDAERQAVIAASALKGKYDVTVDRESAFEILQKRANAWQGGALGGPGATGGAPQEGQGGAQGEAEQSSGGWFDMVKEAGMEAVTGRSGGPGKGRARQGVIEIAMKSAITSVSRTVGTQIARAILRGVLGGVGR